MNNKILSCFLAATFLVLQLTMLAEMSHAKVCSKVYSASEKLNLTVTKPGSISKENLLFHALLSTRTAFNQKTFEKEFEFRLSYELGPQYTIEFLYKLDNRGDAGETYKLSEAEFYLPNGSKSKASDKLLNPTGDQLQINSLDLPLPTMVNELSIPKEVGGKQLQYLKKWASRLNEVDVQQSKSLVENSNLNRLALLSAYNWTKSNIKDTVRKQSFKFIVLATVIWMYTNYQDQMPSETIQSKPLDSYLSAEASKDILKFMKKISSRKQDQFVSLDFLQSIADARAKASLIKPSSSITEFYLPLHKLDSQEIVMTIQTKQDSHRIHLGLEGNLQIRWYPLLEKIVFSHSPSFSVFQNSDLQVKNGSHFVMNRVSHPLDYQDITAYLSQK